jgi:hypothetical protein
LEIKNMTATASGLQVPAPPKTAPEAARTAHSTTEAITAATFGTNHTNTGATGAIVLTLPAASTVAGMSLGFYVTAAYDVQIAPASTEKIYLAGSGTADELLNIAGVVGNFIDIFCDGKKYLVEKYSGVLTKST